MATHSAPGPVPRPTRPTRRPTTSATSGRRSRFPIRLGLGLVGARRVLLAVALGLLALAWRLLADAETLAPGRRPPVPAACARAAAAGGGAGAARTAQAVLHRRFRMPSASTSRNASISARRSGRPRNSCTNCSRTDLLHAGQKASLGEFLERCDLVKFARYEPSGTRTARLARRPPCGWWRKPSRLELPRPPVRSPPRIQSRQYTPAATMTFRPSMVVAAAVAAAACWPG